MKKKVFKPWINDLLTIILVMMTLFTLSIDDFTFSWGLLKASIIWFTTMYSIYKLLSIYGRSGVND